jgi:hypothetical protein
MIMKSVVLLLSLVFSFNIVAAPYGVVSKLIGSATYNGESISLGAKIEQNGLLNIGEKSVLQIKVPAYNSVMTFAPKSSVKLKFKKGKFKSSPYTLMGGTARWVTQGRSKYTGSLKTRSAVMGVRGTDFIAVASPIWDESEIVCLDGKVIFINRKNRKNRYVVNKGQWGGIGGRFGSTMKKPVNLPQNMLTYFSKVLAE